MFRELVNQQTRSGVLQISIHVPRSLGCSNSALSSHPLSTHKHIFHFILMFQSSHRRDCPSLQPQNFTKPVRMHLKHFLQSRFVQKPHLSESCFRKKYLYAHIMQVLYLIIFILIAILFISSTVSIRVTIFFILDR